MPALSEPKYEVFAREVAAGRTRAAAAVAAGYSESDAGSRGAKLAKRPEIAARIAELQEAAAEAVVETVRVTRERVLQELERLAFFDARKLFNEEGEFRRITELDEDTARAVTVVDGKLRLADKNAALQSLARHLGMFRDKVELTGADGGAVQTSVDLHVDAKTLFAAREKLLEAKKLLSESPE